MTRKDTIIIAVFVNAALLIVLFISAIKNDDQPKVSKVQSIEEVKPIALLENEKKEIKAAQGDEIDQILKDFSEKKAVEQEKPALKIDFAKELEAITKAASEQKKPVVPASKGYVTVSVKKGDVLEKIARVHHSSVSEIVQLNHLKSTTLQIGQTLKIPQKKDVKTTGSTSSDKEFYTVKQGDNPWTIAVKNHIKVDELLKLNNLNNEKARHLKPGDKLRIR